MATPLARGTSTRLATSGGSRARRTGSAADGRRRAFLKFFPAGFTDPQYLDWERNYKWKAHRQWEELLHKGAFADLLRRGEYGEVARRAVAIESRTNLLYSFEKIALRDAVRNPAGARTFAVGLFDLLHGRSGDRLRFERWCTAVEELPRVRTRVFTWPAVTVFGFLAQPDRHMFLKPNVTRAAAREYGFPFDYHSRPNYDTYASLLAFAEQIRRDQRALRPRDMIALQSFIWVLGSDEYR